MPGRRDTSDRLPGRITHLLGGGAGDRGATDPGSEGRSVDTVRSAGHHQQRLTIGPEDKAVRDRAHIDAERGCGSGRGGCSIRKRDDLAADSGLTQGIVNESTANGKMRGHAASISIPESRRRR